MKSHQVPAPKAPTPKLNPSAAPRRAVVPCHKIINRAGQMIASGQTLKGANAKVSSAPAANATTNGNHEGLLTTPGERRVLP